MDIYEEEIIRLREELKKKDEFIKNAYKKFGRVFEKFAPFTNQFTKEEREHLVFIGQPIDAISFCRDKILFVEIKTGNSWLTSNQKRVKELIEQRKIEFKEVRY